MRSIEEIIKEVNKIFPKINYQILSIDNSILIQCNIRAPYFQKEILKKYAIKNNYEFIEKVFE